MTYSIIVELSTNKPMMAVGEPTDILYSPLYWYVVEGVTYDNYIIKSQEYNLDYNEVKKLMDEVYI